MKRWLTRLPLKTSPTYYAVYRAGLWHAQRAYVMSFRMRFCVVDDWEPETEERYLDDQIITCLTCQLGLLACSTTKEATWMA